MHWPPSHNEGSELLSGGSAENEILSAQFQQTQDGPVEVRQSILSRMSSATTDSGRGPLVQPQHQHSRVRCAEPHRGCQSKAGCHLFFSAFLCTLAICGPHWSAGADEGSPPTANTASTATAPIPLEVFTKVSPDLVCGSVPSEELHFSFLKQQGIETIISVDGMKPDVESARMYGLTYIHLPIGYDSVPKPTQAALKVIAETTTGPIYVHCHHGKHRGPAAAAILCQLKKVFDTQQATKFLERAGTSKEYAGLWNSVSAFDPDDLGDKISPIVASAEVEPLAESMVRIDQFFEQLSEAQAQGWPAYSDGSRPSSSGALLISEEFQESARWVEGAGTSKALGEELRKSFEIAHSLRIALSTRDFATATKQFEMLKANCRTCHKEHRN